MAIVRWESPLTRWEPFREFGELQREMNRVFDTFTDARTARPTNGNNVFMPAAELEETPDGFELRLEVPGIDPENLDIEATAEAVAIRGERRSEKKVEEKGMTRSEFRYGRFERVIPLPARIQNGGVAANYKDGVLHLSLPKAEEEKNKVVKVALGAADNN